MEVVLGSLSLKSGTMVKRGGTFAKRTCATIRVPKGKAWQDFLKDSENKKQLFNFLSYEFKEAAKNEAYHFFSTKETLSCQIKIVIYLPLNPVHRRCLIHE